VLANDLAPVILVDSDSMTNVAENPMTGDSTPGAGVPPGADPMVTVPLSENVPGYGPSAVPVAWKVIVPLPSALQVAVPVVASTLKRNSPVSLGGGIDVLVRERGGVAAAASPVEARIAPLNMVNKRMARGQGEIAA
jgi:hypothetical protein